MNEDEHLRAYTRETLSFNPFFHRRWPDC